MRRPACRGSKQIAEYARRSMVRFTVQERRRTASSGHGRDILNVDDRSRPNPRARPSWSSPGAALCDGGVLTAAVTR